MHYTDKIDTLKDLFGSEDISLEEQFLQVDGHKYPIVEDVIILLQPHQYPPSIAHLRPERSASTASDEYAPDIQRTFGDEWLAYPDMLADYDKAFDEYFDIVQLDDLASKRVADLGCGKGRWSYYIQESCRELVLVDFSDAIFVARKHITTSNALFFMGDILNLPFREKAFDFAFSIGVLHHLPVDALDATRRLKKFAPEVLIYLYYALDNRALHYRILLSMVTGIRLILSRIHNSKARALLVTLLTFVSTLR